MLDMRIEMDVLDVVSVDAGTNSRKEFEGRLRRMLADVVSHGRIVVRDFRREDTGADGIRENPRIIVQVVATPDGRW